MEQKKKKKKEIKSTSRPNRQTEISKLDGTSRNSKRKTSRVHGSRDYETNITGDHKLYLVAPTNNDSLRPILHPIFIDSVDASISVIIVSLHLSLLSLSFSVSFSRATPSSFTCPSLESSINRRCTPRFNRWNEFLVSFSLSLSLSFRNLIYPFLSLSAPSGLSKVYFTDSSSR